MGGLKKGKGGHKNKTGKGRDGTGKGKDFKRQQDDWQVDVQGPPQERIAAAKPFWEGLTQEQRVEILTISIDDLRSRAKDVAERLRKQAAAEEAEFAAEHPHTAITGIKLEPSLEDILEEGIKRLKEKGTWKLWKWPRTGEEFYDAETFRHWVEQELLEETLRKLLPRDEGKPVEKPAEAGLRLRMTELLHKVQHDTRQLQEEMVYPKRGGRGQRATPDQVHTAVRDTNIELITVMLESLEKEHELLYQLVLFPVTNFVCELLNSSVGRESNRTELFYDDLEKLPQEEVARICEWLQEKVDGFGSKLKPEAKDLEEQEEEEAIGDVDLFALTDDKAALSVNAKWLQHLQERLLGEDGHPRKAVDGEDPFKMGLVLEWVYGTIVSTAEKARDGAKRPLGGRTPNAMHAYDQLVQALRDQQQWEQRAKTAKDLLNEMLASRKEADRLREQGYDIRPVVPQEEGPAQDLPDSVIVDLLKREVLLTGAKLHALWYEHVVAEKKLRSLKAQLRQGEPEFERLKRELEEMKNQPRGLEGTYRTQAEMERHRAQLADQAIEEQLEVQTAFREHGNRLQKIYETKQRTEVEMARREQEIKQLNGWKATVQSVIERFKELSESPNDEGLLAEDANPSSLRNALAEQNPREKLRIHFQKDVRRQLYTLEDDVTFFDWIKNELKSVEKRLEDGRAVLQHMEMFLISVACDDPGATIGVQLALPLLQERLDAKAMEYKDKRAGEAAHELFLEEEMRKQREQAEKERRQKQKMKMKEKVRSEKERLATEKEAREQAERESQEREEKLRAEQEEAERSRKLEEMERLRKEEEEALEARRKVLCSSDNAAEVSGKEQVAEDSPPAPAEPWTEVDAADVHSNISGVKAQEEADIQGNGQPTQRWGLPYNRRRSHPNETPSAPNANERGGGSRSHGRSLNPQPKAIPIRRGERESTRAVPITSVPHGPLGPRFQKQGQDSPGGKMGTNGFRKDVLMEHRPPLGLLNKGKEGEKPKRAAPPPPLAKPQMVEALPDILADSGARQAGASPPDNGVQQVHAIGSASGDSQGEVRPENQPLALQPGRPQSNGECTNGAPDSGWQQGQRTVPQVQFGAVVPPALQPSGGANDVPLLAASLTGEASFDTVSDAGAVSSQPPPSGNNCKTDALGRKHAVSQDKHGLCMSSDVALMDPDNPVIDRPGSRGLTTAGLVATPSKGYVLMPGQVVPPLSSPSFVSHPRQSPRAIPVGPVALLPETPANQVWSAATDAPEKAAVGVSELDSSDEQGHVIAGRNGIRAQVHRPRSIPGPMDPVVHQPNGLMDRPARTPQLFLNAAPNGLLLHEQPKVATSSALANVAPPHTLWRPDHTAGIVEAGEAGAAVLMPHSAQLRVASNPQQFSGPVKGYGQPGLGPRSLPKPPGPRTIDGPQGMVPLSASSDMQAGTGLLPPQGMPQSSNHFGRHRHMHMPSRVQGQNGHVQPAAMSSAGGAVGGMPVTPTFMFPMQPGNQGPYAGAHRGVHLGGNHPMHPSFGGRPPLGSASAAGSPTQGNQPVRISQQFFPGMGPTNLGMSQSSGPPGTPNRDAFMHGLPGNAAVNPQHLPNHVVGMHMVQQRLAPGRSFGGGSSAQLPSPSVQVGAGVGMVPGNALPYSPPVAFPGPAASGNEPGIVKHSFQSSGRGSTPPTRRSGSGRGFSLRFDAQEFVPSHGSARGGHGKTNPRQLELMAGMDHLGRDNGALPIADSHFRRGTAAPGVPFKETPDAHVAVAAYMPRGFTRSEAPAGHALESLERKLSGGLTPLTGERMGLERSDLAASNPAVVEQSSSQFHPAPPSSGASPSADAVRTSHMSCEPSAGWASTPERMGRGGPNTSLTYMEPYKSDRSDDTGVCTPDDGRSSSPTSSNQGASPPSSQVSSAAIVKVIREINFPAEESLVVQRADNTGSSAIVTSMTRVADGGEKRKAAKGPADLKDLKLVRGLRNEAGYNNCFLNVVIQSLWHLRTFRRGLLALDPQDLIEGGRPKEDLDVLVALRDIFEAFSKPLNVVGDLTQSGTPAPSAEGDGSDADSQSAVGSMAHAGDLSVSPTELRKALSSLNTAVHFNESGMHDASEVLGELFDSLHRAECGNLHAGALDPLLPHIVRVPIAMANGQAVAAPSSAQSNAMSLARRLFGLEVQVPTRSEEDDTTVSNKRAKASGGWQEQTSRSSSRNHLQALASGAQSQNKRAKDPNFVEVQQFMTYFHLVPAQGLRSAYDRKVGEFEVMLQMACRADGPLQGAGATQHGSGLLDINLLRMPAVLTLAIVWDSPQAAAEAIRSTVHALKTELQISKVFKGVSSSSGAYRLRCVICYLRHHYQAYALSEEMDQWLLFDDTNIKYVGEWESVVASMIASRHQPSVLFYEHPLL